MKDEPMVVIRVIKAFKIETADYPLDEVCGVRASLAKRFVTEGLAEIINVDEEEDEGEEDQEATADGPAWDDPELGTFHFDDFGWTRRVSLPAFDAFKHGARKRKSAATYPLSFDAEEDELPTPDAVAMAKKLLANQEALATKVAEALWADFTGTGPDSGMYWHDDLDQVAEGIESGEPPEKADDLFRLMQLDEVRIKRTGGRSKKTVAELNFHAAFEEEHGVGVLTDGAEILGIGYSVDVDVFK